MDPALCSLPETARSAQPSRESQDGTAFGRSGSPAPAAHLAQTGGKQKEGHLSPCALKSAMHFSLG